ncbi:MAG: hypothetical protein H7X83_11050, partial [Verrucomicrobia bacterium]|nr:hypothetical protein [Deltaproteobacteria bacterium]
MNSREEYDQRSRSGPRGDPESPFLAEELFNGEAQPEWEVRLAALEGENPFLSAFEQAGVGTVSPGGEYESPVVEFQSAGISGVDNRTEVRDTTIPPYRWVCSIA